MGLFSILGRLGLDTSDFQAGLKRAESSATGFAGRVGKDIKSQLAGAFSAAAAAAIAKKFIDQVDNIANLADAYDMSTESVQRYMEAAERNGVAVEQLIQSTVKLNEARQKATKGDANAIAAFSRFGISLEDVNSIQVTTEDLMLKVAKSSSAASRNFEDQQAMTDLLGAKSARLAEAIRTLESMGPITLIEDSQLRAIDAAADAAEEAIRSAERSTIGVIGNLFRKGQLFFEATRQGDIQYQMELEKGGKDAKERALRAYSLGFRSVFQDISGAKEMPAPVANFPADSGMPTGYTFGGRDTGEMFGPPESKKKASDRSRFDRPDTGNLARIGGLYFGADYNLSLMTLQQEIKRFSERTAIASEKSAEKLSE